MMRWYRTADRLPKTGRFVIGVWSGITTAEDSIPEPSEAFPVLTEEQAQASYDTAAAEPRREHAPYTVDWRLPVVPEADPYWYGAALDDLQSHFFDRDGQVCNPPEFWCYSPLDPAGDD